MKRPVPLLVGLLAVISAFVYFTYRFQTGESFNLKPIALAFITKESTPCLIQQKAETSRSTQHIPGSSNVPVAEVMKGPLAQDDPRVLNYIRNNGFLVPPSTHPYNLTDPINDPSMGQSQVVRQILNSMKNGFFVECGALDGETRSNTLELERNYGWEGLLIEGDPKNIDLALKKNRKAWIAKSCLATQSFPHEVMFKQKFNTGKIASINKIPSRKQELNMVQVQCFPLFSLLSALNVTVVDYFSLDVEGHEFKVLQTIPFDRILIKVLSVEYIHDKEGAEVIERFMNRKGYRVVTRVTNKHNLANDLILVHKSVDTEDIIIETVHT